MAARCNGVASNPLDLQFISVPEAKCCLTASMFPSLAAAQIEMSGTDGPHPTSSTAAIIVSRRCFILVIVLAIELFLLNKPKLQVVCLAASLSS